MSTKGTSLSPATRYEIAKSKRKITKSHLIKSGNKYLTRLQANPQVLPTLSGYALTAGIHRSTLLQYAAKFPEVADIIETIEALQEEYCLINGITNKANSIFSIFLLKSKHNYKDQPTQLTQNNTLNITPELLQDALKLMSKDK